MLGYPFKVDGLFSSGAKVLETGSYTGQITEYIWASVSLEANGEITHTLQGLVWWLNEKIKSIRPLVLSLALRSSQ